MHYRDKRSEWSRRDAHRQGRATGGGGAHAFFNSRRWTWRSPSTSTRSASPRIAGCAGWLAVRPTECSWPVRVDCFRPTHFRGHGIRAFQYRPDPVHTLSNALSSRCLVSTITSLLSTRTALFFYHCNSGRSCNQWPDNRGQQSFLMKSSGSRLLSRYRSSCSECENRSAKFLSFWRHGEIATLDV